MIDKLLIISFLLCMFIIFPLLACLVVAWGTIKLWFAIPLYSALSWCAVNGVIYFRYLLNPETLRGPEFAIALFFGWIYLWVTSIPIFLIYSLIKKIRGSAKPQ